MNVQPRQCSFTLSLTTCASGGTVFRCLYQGLLVLYSSSIFGCQYGMTCGPCVPVSVHLYAFFAVVEWASRCSCCVKVGACVCADLPGSFFWEEGARGISPYTGSCNSRAASSVLRKRSSR